MARLLPRSSSPDVRRIVAGRTIRGFADGFVSVLLAQYLTGLGFSPVEVGAIVTGTLIGSAVLTLGFGFTTHRFPLRTLLLAATAMMFVTGLGFATLIWFWPLFIVAVVGTLNPSAGDVSVFLPTEQALVAGKVTAEDRPRLFAVYNLFAIFAGALGALVSIAPEAIAHQMDWDVTSTQRASFLLYALAGVVIFFVYRRLHEDREPLTKVSRAERRGVLHSSRRTVLELAGLFSLDSAGSGLVVTSLLVLWLHLRFDLSAAQTGAVFFAAGILGGCSQLLAPRLAARFGLIRTMAFTHIPANLLLALAAFAPTGAVAIALLLIRALFAQMDVPARQAFVMTVVPPEERAAASSVTNVPRSLASAATPLLAGVLLTHSTFGWPLLIAGAVKLTYDLILLALYRDVPEVSGAQRSRRTQPTPKQPNAPGQQGPPGQPGQ
jgi:MFS family permease